MCSCIDAHGFFAEHYKYAGSVHAVRDWCMTVNAHLNMHAN